MAKDCILTIRDEVNVRFEGLDVQTRRKLVDRVKYFLPYAMHSPAYKLGRWDGTISYCDIGGRSYINLLEYLIPIVQDAGYAITLDDQRQQHDFDFPLVDENVLSHIEWPKGHPLEGEPIKLREHQVEILNDLFKNPQSVALAATGAGKTVVCAVLSQKVEKYGRSVIIVPSKDLVTQTEEDYINLGLDVGVYYGDRKEIGRKHTICTWQGLEALTNSTKTDITIQDITDDVVCVICDETHKAKADCLRRLLSQHFGHVPIRWGLTGTLPEEEYEKVIIQSLIGEVCGEVSAKDLQEKGILANLHINIEQYKDGGDYGSYQTELAYLTTNKSRVEMMARRINEISETGNTLILVDRVKTGEMLNELIPDSVFINGKVKSSKRKEEYDEVKTVDDKVIIATYGVASTGINIVRIFNLVLIEPGKSFIRVIQSIGRGIRVSKDKDYVNIYDITSSAKYSKRHLTKRKKFYKQQEYPFTVKKKDWV